MLGLKSLKAHHCIVASLSSQALLHIYAMTKTSQPTQSDNVLN